MDPQTQVPDSRKVETAHLIDAFCLWIGIFLIVLSGETGSQLEQIKNSPCGLLIQSACSQRTATGAQHLALSIWIQVHGYLWVIRVPWNSISLFHQLPYFCLSSGLTGICLKWSKRPGAVLIIIMDWIYIANTVTDSSIQHRASLCLSLTVSSHCLTLSLSLCCQPGVSGQHGKAGPEL